MDVEEHEVPVDQKEARDAALARLRDSSPPKRKRPLIVQKVGAVNFVAKLSYHQRTCDSDMVEDDYSRCMASKRENIAAKDQLARLLFHEE
ncbi:unnamed protein product [Nippostrongylus brasiliensis]|uniref:Hexosyltransferase n=1 Tax=Nippostrongylus brasiliensis TaxID=27835 RepID=A0A0N4YZ61_NIPBR|nr:unnamed protein product [Nippostrongylus brasiliensis]